MCSLSVIYKIRSKNLHSLFLVAILSVLLQGCSSLPDFSLPFFSSESGDEPRSETLSPSGVAPEDIIANAAQVKAGEVVRVGNRTMLMGELYTSASGLKCRKVTILGGTIPETRLACKQGPDWCLTKPVLTR
jgi:hypothetical protein